MDWVVVMLIRLQTPTGIAHMEVTTKGGFDTRDACEAAIRPAYDRKRAQHGDKLLGAIAECRVQGTPT